VTAIDVRNAIQAPVELGIAHERENCSYP